MVSVADELLFEHWLDTLPPMDRASVDRVLRSRGYHSRFSYTDVSDARQEGYDRGLAAGRAEKNAA